MSEKTNNIKSEDKILFTDEDFARLEETVPGREISDAFDFIKDVKEREQAKQTSKKSQENENPQEDKKTIGSKKAQENGMQQENKNAIGSSKKAEKNAKERDDGRE